MKYRKPRNTMQAENGQGVWVEKSRNRERQMSKVRQLTNQWEQLMNEHTHTRDKVKADTEVQWPGTQMAQRAPQCRDTFLLLL